MENKPTIEAGQVWKLIPERIEFGDWQLHQGMQVMVQLVHNDCLAITSEDEEFKHGLMVIDRTMLMHTMELIRNADGSKPEPPLSIPDQLYVCARELGHDGDSLGCQCVKCRVAIRLYEIAEALKKEPAELLDPDKADTGERMVPEDSGNRAYLCLVCQRGRRTEHGHMCKTCCLWMCKTCEHECPGLSPSKTIKGHGVKFEDETVEIREGGVGSCYACKREIPGKQRVRICSKCDSTLCRDCGVKNPKPCRCMDSEEDIEMRAEEPEPECKHEAAMGIDSDEGELYFCPSCKKQLTAEELADTDNDELTP